MINNIINKTKLWINFLGVVFRADSKTAITAAAMFSCNAVWKQKFSVTVSPIYKSLV